MIIDIIQNGYSTRRVKPDSPIQLYCGGYPWTWLAGAHFQVKDSAGNLVLDRSGININLARNCWIDWYAPHEPGYYYFTPYVADQSSFIVFEVASDAVVPGDTGGGDSNPDPGTGDSGFNFSSLILPAAIVAAVLLLFPNKK